MCKHAIASAWKSQSVSSNIAEIENLENSAAQEIDLWRTQSDLNDNCMKITKRGTIYFAHFDFLFTHQL